MSTASTPAQTQDTAPITGAEIVLKALVDQGVEVIFGYPGGAVLPIYDALFQQNALRHILVRAEAGAVHAAEGYARSTGKVGVVLVTSGPGATNTVTPLTDALMDSIPLVVLTAQVPTTLIGSDAFQECDTVGITRSCTKHNFLVKDVNDLSRILHEAFYIANSGRPGPVLVDIPKDVQFALGTYRSPDEVQVVLFGRETREKTGTLHSRAAPMRPANPACATFPKSSIAFTFWAQRERVAVPTSFTVLTGTATTDMPAFSAEAVKRSLKPTESPSSGLNSTPTFRAPGTTRLMIATRCNCSGSP